MGGRGSSSGKAGSRAGNREVRKVREDNNAKINQGQQDVINRLNKKNACW